MKSFGMRMVAFVFALVAAVLAATIINTIPLSSTGVESEVVDNLLGWMLVPTYLMLIVFAIKAHRMSGRVTKLEVERVGLRAQRMATSLWKVEEVTFETDMEEQRFVLLKLRHLSWNEWSMLSIRHWHPEFYEASMIRAGMTLEFEAVSDPLNRAEKMELTSYLRLKV